MRSKLISLATAFATCVILLAIAEVGFRAFVAPVSFQSLARAQGGPNVGHEYFNQYDPFLGMRGIPNLKHAMIGSDVTVTHNGEGDRSAEIAKNAKGAAARVVILGDSNAWGYGLADDETFAEQLHRSLSRQGNVEVVNLAVTGYGTDQELLRLIVDGLAYQPNVVILNYFDLNDVIENSSNVQWGVHKPRFVLADGQLCLRDVPVPFTAGWPNYQMATMLHPVGRSLLERLLWSSRIYQFLVSRELRPWVVSVGNQAFSLVDDPRARELISHYLKCRDTKEPLDARSLTVNLLREARAISEKNGSEFLVVLTPTAGNYKLATPGEQFSYIKQELERSGVRTVDLYSQAREANVPPEQLFLNQATDDHLSAWGQEFAAKAVLRVVTDQSFRLDKSPT